MEETTPIAQTPENQPAETPVEAVAPVEAQAEAEETAAEPAYVTIDQFAACDLCVCKVLACEAVKKSKKLLRFELNDGSGTTRQILSGIHAWYEPEELVGKTILAILNLPPRQMMGLESNGMILSAVHTDEEGNEQLNLVMLDDAIPAGARIC